MGKRIDGTLKRQSCAASTMPFHLPMRLFFYLLVFCVPVPAWARPVPQENARRPLGSLSVTGGVQINGAFVSSQSAVYAGDTVTTREDGEVTLTVRERGKFEIGPLTQVVFSDDSRFAAQLILGTVKFDALAEHSNLAVRAGDYVVSAAPGAVPEISATVRRTTDGSALVSCGKGSVQVVALQGDTSLALHAGQSASLASRGDVVRAVVPADPILASPQHAVKRHWLRTVLIVGVAAGVTAVIVASHHSGGPGHAANIGPSPTPTPNPTPVPAPTPSPTPAPTPTPTPPTPTPPSIPTPTAPPAPAPAPPPVPQPPGQGPGQGNGNGNGNGHGHDKGDS